jgi:hypothetical protein
MTAAWPFIQPKVRKSLATPKFFNMPVIAVEGAPTPGQLPRLVMN